MAAILFQKVKEKYNQYSGVYFFIRLFKAVLRKAGVTVERYHYYTNDLSKTTGTAALPEGFEIKRLQYEDIEASGLIAFTGQQKSVYRKRIGQDGYECYAIYNKGEMVYYFSISMQTMECPLPEDMLQLGPDEGLLVDGYCHPQYRGMKLHTSMSLFLLQRLRDMGKKKAVTFIIKENMPARKSQERIGFSLDKAFLVVRIFGKRMVSVKQG